MRHGWLLVVLVVVVSRVQADERREFSSQAIESFEKSVRPILAEHCFECHGAKKQESGLRLDTRAGVLKGGDNGPSVDLKQVERSRLLLAVRRVGDLKMPPESTLKPHEVEALQNWIKGGVAWPAQQPEPSVSIAEQASKHWAFQPVKPTAPPSVKEIAWPQSEIDAFVLAKLEQAGLKPAPHADRRTLVRRAYFDLLGLPPTPEEVAEFLAVPGDDRDAFRGLVDKLLQSPHYGERWGRYWLDLARFADTKGYVFFEDKHFSWAYTYRDYVIRALNDDVPYDRFVLEQLAADQLELGDDKRPLTAMGFLTIGNRFMGNVHDQLDDRIDVVTRGLLGLTVTCARCHSHKYDPIPIEDYYGLYGVFRSSVEPTLPPTFLPPATTDEAKKFESEMQSRLQKLDDFIASTRNEVMSTTRKRAAEYMLAVHTKRGQPSTEDFMLIAEKGALLPVIIHRWEVYLKATKAAGNPLWAVWHRLFDLTDAEFAQHAPAMIREYLAANDSSGVNPLLRAKLQELLQRPVVSMKDVAESYGSLFKTVDEQWQQALKDGGATPPQRLPDDAAEQLRQAIYGPQSPANVPKMLGWGFLDLLPDRPSQDVYKKLLNEVENFSKSGPAAPPRAHVMVDAEQLYEPAVFLRGNPNRESKHVPRAFLSVLTGPQRKPFEKGSGRLEMARAIVDPRNPLTARVFVNRVWQRHFGEGLVRTTSDFGLRGEQPSHPELLDQLATSFMSGGWKIKYLHRAIMNSAVYQTASSVDAEQLARAQVVDPENRLLARFPRRRLDFEATRDALVAVSGNLDRTIGGGSAQILSGFNPRRSVYGYIERLDLPLLMRTFDFPDPASSSGQRAETTVAPQALYFLNDAFISDVARRVLVRPDVASLKEPAAKLKRVFNVCFGRAPTEQELAAAEAFLVPSVVKPIEPTVWRYGFGRFDALQQRIVDFTELTHFTGTRWQASASLPDPKLGWVFLDAKGGHPAEHPDRPAIRRFMAPSNGKYTVVGALKHVPEPGNGVRAKLVSSRSGQLGEWKVHQSSATTGPFNIELESGDTLDFVVDFNGEITHDEHEWVIDIKQTGENPTVWNSEKEFRGQATVDRWQMLTQALLMTNEFVFVD